MPETGTGTGTGAAARRLRGYGKGLTAMADRELRRLSRRELLEMLIAQGRENERLQAEILRLEEQLSEREIHLAQSGNIAEAALRLNGVFEAAQRAAEQYLENISRGEITKALIGEGLGFTAAGGAGETARVDEDGAEPEASAEAPKRKKTGKKRKQPKAPQPKQPKAPKAKVWRTCIERLNSLMIKLKLRMGQLRRQK